MGLHKAYLGRLTIPTSAGAYSNILAARELAFADAIVFYNPAAFTGTISVYVGKSEDTTGDGLSGTLYSGGTAVTLTAGRVERHAVNGFESIQAKTSGTEAGSRAIDVYAILDIGAA